MMTMTCLMGVTVSRCSAALESLFWLDAGTATDINATRDRASVALGRRFLRIDVIAITFLRWLPVRIFRAREKRIYLVLKICNHYVNGRRKSNGLGHAIAGSNHG